MLENSDLVEQDQSRNLLLGAILCGVSIGLTATVVVIAMAQPLGILVLAYVLPQALALILAVILNLSRAPDAPGSPFTQANANSQKGNI